MIYLDANIFISAITSQTTTGAACKAILDGVLENKIKAVTSALTFDEVLWKLRQVMGYELAIDTTERMLELPIKIITVDSRTIREALDLARHNKLKPRDAIHAATMKLHGIKDICSTDPDFDALHWIKRIPPEKLKFS